MGYKDINKQREAARKHYQKNKEQILLRQKQYYQEHPEKKLEMAKLRSEIGKKPENKERRRELYHQNKEKHIQRTLKHRSTATEKRKKWIEELKNDLSCIVCGENRNICLEFHHRDPNEKEFTIGRIIRIRSKELILEEIKKCDVLCSNCHKVEHEKQRLQKYGG
jgi:hypothetical protein